MGERTPLALVSPAASARMAVAESLTNLAAADIKDIATIRLSANWMSAASHPGEGSVLYEAVQAVGMDLCPKLGLTIPVGKDSMSMKTQWDGKSVTAPLSLIVTGFGPVEDTSATWTPELRTDVDEETVLVFLDLAQGHQRLAGSAITQVYNLLGDQAPDVVDAGLIKGFWDGLVALRAVGKSRGKEVVLAYHDRSDGGLFTTIAEMSFAGHVGVSVDVSKIAKTKEDVIPALFNEELGAVIQIRKSDISIVQEAFKGCRLGGNSSQESVMVLGSVGAQHSTPLLFTFGSDEQVLYTESRVILHRAWAETSYKMQSLRDDPVTAQSEYDSILDAQDPGLHVSLTFDPSDNIVAPLLKVPSEQRPRVAILREQGVNSMFEMAWAFHSSGFTAVDVHMTDLLSGRVNLGSYVGLACPGGFSYGDVLGAGAGWAKSVLMNPVARTELQEFFGRKDTFTIGICNGCQMLAQLKSIIPGAEGWPVFVRNRSEQFEARVATLEVLKSHDGGSTTISEVFFKGMEGSKIPIAVAHGEGRAEFSSAQALERAAAGGVDSCLALRYVDNYGAPAGPERYPLNPNGSPLGVAGVVSVGDGGKVLALMPHPERVVRGVANTWATPGLARAGGEDGGWIRMFRNARLWVEKNKSL
jgi:phosphoribosylformylglycinamidine synthase